MSRPAPRVSPARFLPLAAGLLAVSAAPASGQVFFDDFLFDNAGQPEEDFDDFFLWTVTDGTVDLVGGNVPGATTPDLGGRYVDLDGGNAGRFETAIDAQLSLLPGVAYDLSFLYNSTSGANAADVFVESTSGSRLFTAEVFADSLDFREFSGRFTVDAATTASIVFQDRELGLDEFGIGVDRVMFAPAAPAAVPEPTTWALLGVTALGAAAYRRRTGRI